MSFTDAKGFIGTRIITATGPQTPVPTLSEAAPSTPVISAHAKASRASPAYFSVKTNPGPVMVYTSSSIDWVIEYVDDNDILHVENNQDAQNPEKAAFTGSGNTIFVKIYPYDNTVTGRGIPVCGKCRNNIREPDGPCPFAPAAPQATGGLPSAPADAIIRTGSARNCPACCAGKFTGIGIIYGFRDSYA